jgi:hypothetical protein
VVLQAMKTRQLLLRQALRCCTGALHGLLLQILLRHAMLLWYAIHGLRHLLALLLLCLRCTNTNIGVRTALLQ